MSFAGLTISGAIILVAVIIALAVSSENEWQRFAEQHQCRVVGEISGSSSLGVGIGTNGGVAVVPVFTPGKTGYACNDGKVYWR